MTNVAQDGPAAAARRARAWLMGEALPLWGTIGLGPDGAFRERLHLDASPDLACPRRMRVQARQLYVYSEAAVRGWWPGARAVAEAGFEGLRRAYWARDGRPGFIHTVTPDGALLDARRDTYDHAFGLFALAWFYKLTRAPEALALAHASLDVLEQALADPVHGGFLESAPAVLPRRADPHMHLLEAMLEWVEATGEARFLDQAARMVALFRRRFFDSETGTLGEYFAADLSPAPGPEGQATMPGHHMEWCWLLAWARALGAGDASAEATRLYAYALRHGLDAQGLAVDECDRHGSQVRRSRRAWPQTELIKGYLTAARAGDAAAGDAAAAVCHRFMDAYLSTEVPGLWVDQYDDRGALLPGPAPASTFYHIAVAFRELMLFAGLEPQTS